MEYYSAIERNETGSFAVMWMLIESVIQSEVSQKEKNKCCILTHIYSLEKWCRWTYLQGRNSDADLENRHEDAGLGEGEVGQMGSVALTYIRYHVSNRWLVGSFCVAWGAQLSLVALWWPGRGDVGVGGRFKREGCMYTCNSFMLLCSRN